MKILHFADAHIDMANYGRHDPMSGLPLRVLDFLKSLDTIVDTAIGEKVDFVIFAGDTYKDRTPSPTIQREWGKRIMRLSQAKIPTLLLVGNHDLSPASGRANAIHEFDTLQVPYVRVQAKPEFLRPDDLDLPLQVIAIPWVSRSGLMAGTDISAADPAKVHEEIEQRLTEIVLEWLDQVDASLPVILTAHASIQGAQYGNERMVMLGSDLVLPGSLVKDRRLDYTALGHIHKPQNLNEGAHPPVIYPGSIERVDFGEVHDRKFFIVAEVARGKTEIEWRELTGIRPFIDRNIELSSAEDISGQLISALPPINEIAGAIIRLTVIYPRDWEPLIDDSPVRAHTDEAFEFQFIKHPQTEARIRLPADQVASSLSPLDLLDLYWRARHADEEDIEGLQRLAGEILSAHQE